jgi:hypothetical protein
MNLDNLLPMDRAWLRYLMERVGIAPTIAIPARLFRGEIPEGSSSLVELGLIEHVSDRTAITLADRRAIEVADVALEMRRLVTASAQNGSPSGFKRLPTDVQCSCIRMWRAPDGIRWCCNPRAEK